MGPSRTFYNDKKAKAPARCGRHHSWHLLLDELPAYTIQVSQTLFQGVKQVSPRPPSAQVSDNHGLAIDMWYKFVYFKQGRRTGNTNVEHLAKEMVLPVQVRNPSLTFH